MTVSLRNTPSLAGPTTGTGTITTASTYGTGTPAAGDLLVAVITMAATTTTTVGTAPAGWTLSAINETNSASTETRVFVYTRTATGTTADNAPSIVNTCSGTSARDAQTAVLYDFYDSSGGTPVLATYGVAQGTTTSPNAPVTTGSLSAGSYAVAAMAGYYTSGGGSPTWTTPV